MSGGVVGVLPRGPGAGARDDDFGRVGGAGSRGVSGMIGAEDGAGGSTTPSGCVSNGLRTTGNPIDVAFWFFADSVRRGFSASPRAATALGLGGGGAAEAADGGGVATELGRMDGAALDAAGETADAGGADEAAPGFGEAAADVADAGGVAGAAADVGRAAADAGGATTGADGGGATAAIGSVGRFVGIAPNAVGSS